MTDMYQVMFAHGNPFQGYYDEQMIVKTIISNILSELNVPDSFWTSCYLLESTSSNLPIPLPHDTLVKNVKDPINLQFRVIKFPLNDVEHQHINILQLMLPQIYRLVIHDVWKCGRAAAVNLGAARACIALGQFNGFKSGTLNIHLNSFVSQAAIQKYGRDELETEIVALWEKLSAEIQGIAKTEGKPHSCSHENNAEDDCCAEKPCCNAIAEPGAAAEVEGCGCCGGLAAKMTPEGEEAAIRIYYSYLAQLPQYGSSVFPCVVNDKKSAFLCFNTKCVFIFDETDGKIVEFEHDKYKIEFTEKEIQLNDLVVVPEWGTAVVRAMWKAMLGVLV